MEVLTEAIFPRRSWPAPKNRQKSVGGRLTGPRHAPIPRLALGWKRHFGGRVVRDGLIRESRIRGKEQRKTKICSIHTSVGLIAASNIVVNPPNRLVNQLTNDTQGFAIFTDDSLLIYEFGYNITQQGFPRAGSALFFQSFGPLKLAGAPCKTLACLEVVSVLHHRDIVHFRRGKSAENSVSSVHIPPLHC